MASFKIIIYSVFVSLRTVLLVFVLVLFAITFWTYPFIDELRNLRFGTIVWWYVLVSKSNLHNFV